MNFQVWMWARGADEPPTLGGLRVVEDSFKQSSRPSRCLCVSFTTTQEVSIEIIWKIWEKNCQQHHLHPQLALGNVYSVCSVVTAHQGALLKSVSNPLHWQWKHLIDLFFSQRHTRLDTSKCFWSSLTPKCLTPLQIELRYSCHVSRAYVKHSTCQVWRRSLGKCYISNLNLLLWPANID